MDVREAGELSASPGAAVTTKANQLRDIVYVADILGISVKTLYRWVSDDKGPKPTRVGRLLRWTDSSIQAYIDEATVSV